MTPTPSPAADRSPAGAPALPDPARQAALYALQRDLTGMVRWAGNHRLHSSMIVAAGVRIDKAAFSTLSIVGDNQPIRSSHLSAMYGLDVSTISKSVRDLEARGLVVRDPVPDDQRASMLRLTPRGEEVLATLRATVVGFHDRCLDDWTVEEIETFSELSRRYTVALSWLFETGLEDWPDDGSSRPGRAAR
jgi:MarR family transcriptional regulator for hemolysin